ncbi:unnamed protein product [Urochloa decumbens]|uniref:HMA domain-containing protein n=1 Tax=Urochloa decumbens TaxID=240449 RepID=A0ABC9F6U8_9POAL
MAMAAKKVVLLLGLHDNDAREKRKVLKAVSAFPGLDLISIDMKASKLTVVGKVDPIVLVTKLRKLWHADILSVEPANNKEDKAAAAAAAGGVKENEEGDRKHQEVTAVLVESRPADTRSWPHAVVYPAPQQHPYPYRPDQYVAGGLGAQGNPHNNNLYVAGGGHGARENRPNSSYGVHGHGTRRNHPNSYGAQQDPNACAIC